MTEQSRSCVIPGSYDPVTLGHLDLIRRATLLFPKVCVTVFRNSDKTGMFSYEDRLAMLKLATADLPTVSCSFEEGLLADFARRTGSVVVKGIRSAADAELETYLSLTTRSISPETETVFLPARQEFLHLSSSYVRELIRYGASLRDAVPPAVESYINKQYKKKEG